MAGGLRTVDQFLEDAELQEYTYQFKEQLKIHNIYQLKYVKSADLVQIGLSKPEQRRYHKIYSKYFPNPFAKFKDFLKAAARSATPFQRPPEQPPAKQETPSYNWNYMKLPENNIIPMDAVAINKEIGKGQFGVVQQGTWTTGNLVVVTKNGRDEIEPEEVQVAVKCLGRGHMKEDAAEILKEAAVLHRIDHPNIIRIFGIILHDESIMLVTELAPLRSLLECLREVSLRPNFLVPNLCEFAEQICEGMVYLENNRLIHRDLAARNVLVFSKDQVKISDFGLSRGLGVGKDYYQTNYNENLKLPVAWCAPECILYLRFTSSSDVWAFGVCLWEMFTFGFQPWAGFSGQQILDAIDRPNGQRLERPQCCPEDYYATMLKCWAHHPDDRPTFKNLLDRLRSIRPEQVQALVNCIKANDAPHDNFLEYKVGQIVTVLGKANVTHSRYWFGALAGGPCGLFDPSLFNLYVPAENNVTPVTSLTRPSSPPRQYVQPFSRNDIKQRTYVIKRSIQRSIISASQGDIRRTSTGNISISNPAGYPPRQIATPYRPSEDTEHVPLINPNSPSHLSVASGTSPYRLLEFNTTEAGAGSGERNTNYLTSEGYHLSNNGYQKMNKWSSTIVPSSTTPGTVVPRNESLSTLIPRNRSPSTVMPSNTAPSAVLPRNRSPSTVVPRSGSTSTEVSRNGAQSTAVPRNRLPSTAVPSNTAPGTQMPSNRSGSTASNRGLLSRVKYATLGRSYRPETGAIPKTQEVHEYQEISDDDTPETTQVKLSSKTDVLQDAGSSDFSQSLLNEMETRFRNLDTTHRDEPTTSRGSPDGTMPIRNQALIKSDKKRASPTSTMKPMSAHDEKTLNTAVAMANEITSKSMNDLDTEKPKYPHSPNERSKFHFKFLHHGHHAHEPERDKDYAGKNERRNFSEEAQSVPDIQSTLTEESKMAYTSLIEEPTPSTSLISHLNTDSTGRMKTSNQLVNLAHANFQSLRSNMQAHSNRLRERDYCDANFIQCGNNPLPLPPKSTKPKLVDKPRHVRKYPLKIPVEIKPTIESSDPKPIIYQNTTNRRETKVSSQAVQGVDVHDGPGPSNLDNNPFKNAPVKQDVAGCSNASGLVRVGSSRQNPFSTYSFENLDDMDLDMDDDIEGDSDDSEEETDLVGTLVKDCRDHVSVEDLLDFADQKPCGRQRGVESDEVRVMLKVFKEQVTPQECLEALEISDWNILNAIKLVRVSVSVGTEVSLVDCSSELTNANGDISKAILVLCKRKT